MADSYVNVQDLQNFINDHEIYLKIVREGGDKVLEANIYCNLGNAYHSLGDFQEAIEYHERVLKISKEIGRAHV